MSAVSTVYKRPSSVTTAQDDDERAVIYTGGLVTVFMWILVGLASAVNTNLTSNYKGIDLIKFYLAEGLGFQEVWKGSAILIC